MRRTSMMARQMCIRDSSYIACWSRELIAAVLSAHACQYACYDQGFDDGFKVFIRYALAFCNGDVDKRQQSSLTL